MSQSTAYSRMSGRLKESAEDIDSKLLDEDRLKVENHQHQQWLSLTHTQQYLAKLENSFLDHCNRACNEAAIGNDEVAIRLLIRAKTIKETLDYVRRNAASS